MAAGTAVTIGIGLAFGMKVSQTGRVSGSTIIKQNGGSSLGTSILNLSKNIIGAGMLSLPFAMKVAGVVPFMVGITIIAAINAYTFFLIGWCCHQVGASSFGKLWSKTLGPHSAWVVDLSVLLNNGFSCISYCATIGDFITKALVGLLPWCPALHHRAVVIV